MSERLKTSVSGRFDTSVSECLNTSVSISLDTSVIGRLDTSVSRRLNTNVSERIDTSIMFCQIAKVASTNLGKIFGVLTGKSNSSNPEDIKSKDVHYALNKQMTHLNEFQQKDVIGKIQTYYKFMFVRDPFERLVSGYRNKFQSPANKYFMRLSKKIVEIYRQNKTQTGSVTFIEFIEHLIDPLKRILVNGHWRPFHELCNPCKVRYDFIGKLSTMEEDLAYILQVNGLTGGVQLPRQYSPFSFHNTHLFLYEFFSQLPKETLRKLYEKYYPDYAIFDLQLPDVIQKMLKS
ncbi:Carbohydrate sulfotransferase 11 [Bulinus truncatus]|nr:Carbohydrate sulfotransferase 11 [Bulinus truncatus]